MMPLSWLWLDVCWIVIIAQYKNLLSFHYWLGFWNLALTVMLQSLFRVSFYDGYALIKDTKTIEI